MRPGSRRSGNTQDNFAAKPRRRSAMARSMTPPSDVSLPPSNEAVIFLRETAGNENGRTRIVGHGECGGPDARRLGVSNRILRHLSGLRHARQPLNKR